MHVTYGLFINQFSSHWSYLFRWNTSFINRLRSPFSPTSNDLK